MRRISSNHRLLRAAALALAVPVVCAAATDFSQVPGVVVDHSAQPTGLYVGSPSIAILPNGDYIASHDLFGPSSGTNPNTVILRSTDRGGSWTKLATVSSTFWSNLFVDGTNLYLMGTSKEYGNLQIRKSTNGGLTWTTPSTNTTGLLKAAGSFGYHTAPVPMVISNGRVWRAFEDTGNGGGWGAHFRAFVMSAPVGSDLLRASNWTYSNTIARDTSWLPNNSFNGFLEGNIVVDPSGTLRNLLRIDNHEKAASIRVNSTTQISFDPGNDIINFPGGAKKFQIRYDATSGKYWALSNPLLPGYQDLSPGATRNALAVTSSTDLRNWKINQIIAFHPDTAYHGFQYPDWQFDGPDMVAVSRTAYDDGLTGAHSYHDANLMTFHRVENFRANVPTRQVLLADTNNNRVMRYDVVRGAGGTWLLNGSAAMSGSIGGAALTTAFGLAQDGAGRIYVGEQKDGGRILRFDTAGTYLGTVATEGANFAGRPEAMTLGPDGNVYMSVAFGTNSDKVYKIDAVTGAATVFASGVTLSDPRGLAFGSDGALYVADRNNNVIRKFDGVTGIYRGDLVNSPNRPQGLNWDEHTNRLIATGSLSSGGTDVVSLALDGTRTLLASVSRSPILLDAARVDGEVFYTDYTNSAGYRVADPGDSTLAVADLNGPGHLLEITNSQTWSGSGGYGNWSATGNWSSQSAPAFDGSAAMTFSGTAQTTSINDVADASVAGIIFDAGAGAFQISGHQIAMRHIGGGIVNNSHNTQTISVQRLSMTAQPIDAAAADILINSPIDVTGLIVVKGTHVTSLNGSISGAGCIDKRDSGALRLAGSNSFTGGVNVSAGRVVVQHASALGNGSLAVAGGAVTELSGNLGKALVLRGLSIEVGGVMDIANNKLVIDYADESPLSAVSNVIARGRGDGSWTGTGLRSSFAAAYSGNPPAAVGIAEAAALGLHSFGGRDVDADALLIAYTLAGDANLDGAIDSLDFIRLSGRFGQTGAGWQGGDFNYDGRTNALDFNVIASGFGAAMPAPAQVPLISIAPEPGAALAMLAGGASLATRQRVRAKGIQS